MISGRKHPHAELILSSNNNRVDLTDEGLDYAIRYGSGAWHGTDAVYICDAPLSLLCTPALGRKLKRPADVLQFTLLRSCRRDEWSAWLQASGELPPGPTQRIMMFDSSLTMVKVALTGAGVALAPPDMFRQQLRDGSLCRPFSQFVDLGGYWLTSLQSRSQTAVMQEFTSWLLSWAGEEDTD